MVFASQTDGGSLTVWEADAPRGALAAQALGRATVPRAYLAGGWFAVAVRKPARVALPESAYSDMTGLSVPESLSDLELLPGRCFSTFSVAQCPQSGANVVCAECAMVELGESWENFKARTNAAVPKAKFYRDLDTAQAALDPHFRRLLDSRAALARTR